MLKRLKTNVFWNFFESFSVLLYPYFSIYPDAPEEYTGDFLCIFIHCNEAMKISKSLQWKQWKQWNWETKFFYQFGPNPRIFFKKWPVPWSFIAFLMHSFFKIFHFQAEKTLKKWILFKRNEILESDPKLAWNLKNDTPRLFIALF